MHLAYAETAVIIIGCIGAFDISMFIDAALVLH